MQHLQTSIDTFIDYAQSQEQKGIEKYGQPLDPLESNRDWLVMAIEEQVDGFQYLVAEMKKRKFVVDKIRKAINYKDNSVSKTEINHWLDVLEGRA